MARVGSSRSAPPGSHAIPRFYYKIRRRHDRSTDHRRVAVSLQPVHDRRLVRAPALQEGAHVAGGGDATEVHRLVRPDRHGGGGGVPVTPAVTRALLRWYDG